MVRKTVSIFLITMLLLNMTLSAAAARESQLLSDMTAMECLEFVKSRGVQIPEDYEDETVWASFVKDTITQVEENPNFVFCYSYTVTQAFAQEIQAVVNAYYGASAYSVANNSAVQQADAYTLQENTPLSDWDELFTYYNCYVYAIREDDTYFRDPGYYYNLYRTANEEYIGIFSLDMSFEEQVSRILLDLEKLGNICISSSTRRPLSGTLRENQYAICYRVGLADYHFMRMDEVGWTHKPSNSIPLLYHYLPTVSRVWLHEYVDGTSPKCGTTTYNSVIQFITYSSTHEYYYAYYENQMHRYWCLDCDEPEEYEACEYAYEYNSDGTHTKVCIKCGNETVLDCSFSYSTTNTYQHTKTCEICNHSEVENCDLYTEYCGSGAHVTMCTYCDRLAFASCTGVLTHYEDETLGDAHRSACQDCGNVMSSATESCTLQYIFAGTVNGTNTHSRVCTECGYVQTQSAFCFYKNGNYCFFCGTHKDTVQAASLDDLDTKE